jgi:hypothetical protein
MEGLAETLILPSRRYLTSSPLEELKAMLWSQRPDYKIALIKKYYG